MLRTGRILLVEPEESLRRRLDDRLEEAGHDVAPVADDEAAVQLLQEGLDPDVVLAELDGERAPGHLRSLAPLAAHLRIDRRLESSARFQISAEGGFALCTSDPVDVLDKIEEALLDLVPTASVPPTEPVARATSAEVTAPMGPGASVGDLCAETNRCLDLARRLTNALPRIADPGERTDLVIESFDVFFGVVGTLVIHRGADPADWVEASQGLDARLAQRVSEEISRRALGGRGIRPFLTDLEVDGARHAVACLAVQLGEQETVLALALRSSPKAPSHRESLMNLVGSAMRSASQSEELERGRELTRAQAVGLEGLIDMTRTFSALSHPRQVAGEVLKILRREVMMARSALFAVRRDGGGLLDRMAVAGFPPAGLDRIGLSRSHGVGQVCLERQGILRLNELSGAGVGDRELRILSEVGLCWGTRLVVDDRPLGVLFFGSVDDHPELQLWEKHLLDALLASASAALRNVENVEDFRDLALIGVKGLVGALELHQPAERGHAARVAQGAVTIGRAAGLDESELRELSVCAFLHDVGKIAAGGGGGSGASVTGSMEERKHPLLGSRMLSPAGPPPAVLKGIEQHHERWDGHGFPYGLRGSGIHAYARMVSIADAYDRFLHDPAQPMSADDALRRLERGAGLIWDPGLVASFSSEVGRGPDPASSSDADVWLDRILGLA